MRETLPDHMRLDTYGNTNNWREGLSQHRQWLRGVPFTQANLDAEKPKIRMEAEHTARSLATHKFALAAWSQGFRHGQAHSDLQVDLERASLQEIQHHRDKHLPVTSNVLVCIVGGVEPARGHSAISEQLGTVRLDAAMAERVQLHPGNREMTWDLNARHLILTWPIPQPDSADYPALCAAAQWLNMKFLSDPELKNRVA